MPFGLSNRNERSNLKGASRFPQALRAESGIGCPRNVGVRVPQVFRNFLDGNTRLSHEPAGGPAQVMPSAMGDPGALHSSVESGLDRSDLSPAPLNDIVRDARQLGGLESGHQAVVDRNRGPAFSRPQVVRGFRVLKPNGTLIFKWNEHEIRVREILALTDQKPLFGNRCGKTAKSHWIVFMKLVIAAQREA